MRVQIIKYVSGKATIITKDGYKDVLLRGKLKDAVKPRVGDEVEFDEENKVITEIYARKNELVRPYVSNVDGILIILSCKPMVDLNLVDKILIDAKNNGLERAICINKIDLVDNEFINKIKNQYSFIKNIFETNAISGLGVDCLKKYLANKLTVIAGQSGVGKSSLINTINPLKVRLTQELSKKIDRGVNTTTQSEIITLDNGGRIIDTPGFSMLTLCEDKNCNLSWQYEDIREFARDCEYTSCNHINKTSAECSVIKALEEGKLNKERYERYALEYEKLKNPQNFIKRNLKEKKK